MSIINTGLINKLDKKKLAKDGGYLRGSLLSSLTLTAISINTAGTGYAADDLVCVDNTGATTASGSEIGIICVQTVDGSGVIQTAAIKCAGTYDVVPTTVTGNVVTGGGGTGACFDITLTSAVCLGSATQSFNKVYSCDVVLSGNVTLGDTAADDITVEGDLTSNLIPNASDTYNLGSVGQRWEDIYVDDIDSCTLQVCNLTSGRIVLAGTTGVVEDSANLSFTGTVFDVTGCANVSNDTTITSTTNSTSASSGALVITGGLGVGCDVYIGGDLVVSGDQTTVCSNCVLIGDSTLTLNSDEVGTPTENAGLEIERGTADNAHLTWNETTDKWELKLGTALADLCVANVITDSSGSGSAIGTPTEYACVFHRTPQLTNGYSGSREGASVCLENTDGLADAIHILNDTILNVRQDTYVRDVSWSTDSDYDSGQCISSANTAIAFTFCWMGNPSCIDIDWGDGSSDCKLTGIACDGSSVVSKTYGSGAVGCNTVCATAINTSGLGYGSVYTLDCANYMLIATPTPDSEFAMYNATPVNVTTAGWDSASAVCLCNTSTETGATTSYGNTASYCILWGDTTTDTVATDAADGGRDGAGLAHTWTNSASGDTQYDMCLVMCAHSTTNPSVLPIQECKKVDVFSTQVPAFTSDVSSGNNEEATTGLPVAFTGSVDTLGAASAFGAGNCWRWVWDDGTSNCEVAAGGGGAGDYNVAVSHTFVLTGGEQAAGTTVTRDVCLQAYSGHTSSPFTTAVCTITITPDPRSNVAVIFQNEATGIDNASDVRGYAYVGYDGLNYALGCGDNTSQNATCYEYNWGDSSALDCMAHGSTTAGDYGVPITHDYTSAGTGTYNGNLLAYNPTLSLNATDDTETFTMDILATPGAPANLSTKTIAFIGEDTGTNPKVASGFTDNTGGATIVAGDAVDRTTDTTGTIDSDVITTYAYDAVAGNLCALVNAVADGCIAFSASDNTGLDGATCITEDIDANTVSGLGVVVSGSNKVYPSNFYRVFKARVSKTASAVSVGANSFQLCHSTTGATPEIEFVKDDVTANPALDISGVTVSQAAAGTIDYISGVPYYTTGGQVTLAAVQAYDWIGQTYQDASDPFSIEHGTNDESTSGSIISTQTKTYANIDGSSTFLSGGIPVADTGKTSASKYTLGDLTFNVNGSVNAVATVKANLSNINGEGAYSSFTTKINLKGTSLSGFLEEDITITSLGTGSGNGKRVSGITAGDNPTYGSSTDYYASNAWTGGITVAGTDEAIVRWGQLKHYSTDLSSGYLPVGPDLATGRSGGQYFRGAFKRSVVSSFGIVLDGKISGFWIALPGETTDSSSGLGGWLDCTATYGGAGMPGSNTGAGGNGSDGVADGNSNKVTTGSAVNTTFTMNLGTGNLSNTYNNQLLFNIKLASGDYINSLSFT